ncbi:MAG: DUF6443 domain-containing protein [Bacteroidales bacterium]|jgi:RHS repeat-associated protein|nr:DUF6443 domain-containing protein [Bacteroidales bacterium]
MKKKIIIYLVLSIGFLLTSVISAIPYQYEDSKRNTAILKPDSASMSEQNNSNMHHYSSAVNTNTLWRDLNYLMTVTPLQEISNTDIAYRTNIVLPDQTLASVSIEYFDALGRPLQNVVAKASPEGKDLVTPIKLDAFERNSKIYLPYVSSDGTGVYKRNAIADQKAFYQPEWTTWSTMKYESSATGRILIEGVPGDAWNSSQDTLDKGITYFYRTNYREEVPVWSPYGIDSIMLELYFDPGTLRVVEITDEDDRKTIQYTDLDGNMIRHRRKIASEKYADTDYVYDNKGRLCYVFPPVIPKNQPKIMYSVLQHYVYEYRYDYRDRIIEKYIPGAGWTHIVYNKLDQPVMTQDAIQREKGEWAFTKYDAIGRMVMSGIVQDGRSRRNWQEAINAQTAPLWESPLSGGICGYTNQSEPKNLTTGDVYLVNYYDSYDFPGSESIYTHADDRVKGFVTGNKTRILDTDEWLTATLFYDNKGRLLHTVAEQPKIDNSEVKDKVTLTYDFTGKVLSTVREHLKGGTAVFALTEINRYDHAGRLLEVKQHITGNDTVVVAANTYNELGQLVRTDLHNNSLESTGYNYNIRGWLREITGNLFSQKLHYHESVSSLNSTPQWGGNISAMEWKTPSRNDYWHAYAFKYDSLSRLKEGAYARSNATGNSNTTYGSDQGKYNEGYRYDIMGNIRKLDRWHNGDQIDQLTLSYNGNQLGQASDSIIHEEDEGSSGTGIIRVITLNSPANAGIREACEGFVLQPGFQFAATSGNDLTLRINDQLCTSEPSTPGFVGNGTYGYDAAGRMTTDSNKGITIAYNHLNLPTLITKDQETLEYTYDAIGRRIRKKFGSKERHYIDGVEYEGSELKFISTQYGRIRKTTSGWVYDYFLKDHLGNVRVVLTSDPDNRQRYMATMEEGKSGEEGLYFDNLENTRSDRPYNYPDKNPANSKLAKVAGKSQGPKITLKVMAGDTIEISAQAFYNIDKSLPGSGLDIAPVAASAIAALSGNATAPLGEFSTLATDLGATASTSAVLAPLPAGNNDEDSPQPESGLNFVLYNREFEVVEAHTGLLPVDDKINKIQQLSGDKMVLSESGYMEIYVNNEAQTPVYFDNLSVTRSSGNAVEVNAYYPYGMIIPLLSDHEVEGFNAYKYNVKELQEEMELNWLDYGARMLATEIPVWFVPDAYAEKYYHLSPYSFAAGNPINNIDINGDSIKRSKAFESDKDAMDRYNAWAGTDEGKAFIEAFEIGGKYGHISVNFVLGDLPGNGRAETFIVNKKTGESKEYEGNLGEKGRKLALGQSSDEYLKYELQFDFAEDYTDIQLGIAEGAKTINHEKQHLLINQMTLLKKKERISPFEQHKMMNDPNGIFYSDRYSFYKQLKPLWKNDYNSKLNHGKVKNLHNYIHEKINNFTD